MHEAQNLNRRIYFQLTLVALLASSLQWGCSLGDGSIPGELEVSPIDNDDPDRGYRVFVKSQNPKILNKLRINPAHVKELYLSNTDAKLLQSLGDYPNLECVDLTALPYEITSFDFLANLQKMKTLGIHTTAVTLTASATLQPLPTIESIYIDCLSPDTMTPIALISSFPNARSLSRIFCYGNQKDLLARQILKNTDNYYLVTPSKEQTSIQSFHYGKDGHAVVNVVLRNANPQAIKSLTDVVELRKIRIESPDIKYDLIQEILKNTAIKTLEIRRMNLSETELEQLHNQYPAISIEY